MTKPWFPCASTPIASVAVDCVDQTLSEPVVATVMPIASDGDPDICTVTD
jgi:hypothetical protein